MDSPIFIFGQARSGSTLVQRLLNSLDRVIIYGEHIGMLNGIAATYSAFVNSPILDQFLVKNAAEAGDAAFKRLKDPTDFAPHVNGLTLAHVQNSYRNFVRQMFHCIPSTQDYRWGFKEICYQQEVFEMLRALFPAAFFVFVVRHPVDHIASKEGTGWWWNDSVEKRAIFWQQQAASHLRCYKAHRERSFFVRYEELISPATNVGKQLIEFLGYEYTPRQHEIIFEIGKVGAADGKPTYSEEVREKICSICLTPDIREIYPC